MEAILGIMYKLVPTLPFISWLNICHGFYLGKEVPYDEFMGEWKRRLHVAPLGGLCTFKLVGSILLPDRLLLARILTTNEEVSSLHAASIDVNIKNSKTLDRSFLFVNIRLKIKRIILREPWHFSYVYLSFKTIVIIFYQKNVMVRCVKTFKRHHMSSMPRHELSD